MFSNQVQRAQLLSQVNKQGPFANQVSRAHLLSQAEASSPLDFAFAKQADTARARVPLSKAINTNNVKAVTKNIRSTEFNTGMDLAYKARRGFAIRSVGGQKVMFVSGSRNITDWVANFIDPLLPSKYQKLSNKTVKNLELIAARNNVQVVVGHSRGGKLVDQMNGPYQKLGVDGAMMISTGKRKTMNVYGSGYRGFGFDNLLALRGKNNYKVPLKNPLKTHYIYRDYKDYKPYKQYKHKWYL